MTKLTMKDLATKLSSLGYYVDNGTIEQVQSNFKVETELCLSSYIKSLDSKRNKRKKYLANLRDQIKAAKDNGCDPALILEIEKELANNN